MHELIKIENTTIGDACVPTVSARELHEFLGVNTKFNTWIKRRIEECRLLENRGYIWVSQNWETQTSQGKLGVATQKVVVLSIDAAKHISMIERTDKGFEAREYFIECEKRLQQVLSSKYSYQLDIINASTERERMLAFNNYEVGYVQPLEQFKEQALPKVSYYDNVLNSPGLVTITQIAKDYGMTAVEFNKLLESLNIQYKQSGQWLLYHNYAKAGYTQSSTFVTEYGNSKLNTKWTQKGRLFIYDLLKSKGILPVCEQKENL